ENAERIRKDTGENLKQRQDGPGLEQSTSEALGAERSENFMKYRNETKTSRKKWILPVAVAALASASLSACGGVAYREAGTAGNIPGAVIPTVTGGTG